MVHFRRAVLWAALIAIVLLTLLSIYGAFLGAERAQAFFNTVPLAVYWLVLIALLSGGIAAFRRLLRVPSLLLLHAGSILVLIGAMWGSTGGHALAKRLFGIDKIPQGQMGILEQSQENRVVLADSNEARQLPFFVRLKDFRMEYYQPGSLLIRSSEGQEWRLPAQIGQSFPLGGKFGTVTVQRVFENWRMDIQSGKRVYDEPGGSNPALEVTEERPGEPPRTRYAFEQRMGHGAPDDSLKMIYSRTVKDYVSELEIIRDGKVVAAKNIEVNHPLHYGGYHFFQHSYGQDKLGDYTVLMVVSDSGLNLVYSGYLMLVVGVFWHFWGRPILAAARNRRAEASEVAVAANEG